MRRWLLTVLFGPRCDARRAVGGTCLKPARWTSPRPAPATWRRKLRWCDDHRANDDAPYVRESRRRAGGAKP